MASKGKAGATMLENRPTESADHRHILEAEAKGGVSLPINLASMFDVKKQMP
jgi:hypothetical protein